MHSPNPILGGFILCCHLGGSSRTGHHPYIHQQWMSLELIGMTYWQINVEGVWSGWATVNCIPLVGCGYESKTSGILWLMLMQHPITLEENKVMPIPHTIEICTCYLLLLHKKTGHFCKSVAQWATQIWTGIAGSTFIRRWAVLESFCRTSQNAIPKKLHILHRIFHIKKMGLIVECFPARSVFWTYVYLAGIQSYNIVVITVRTTPSPRWQVWFSAGP